MTVMETLDRMPFTIESVPWGDQGRRRDVARYTCRCGTTEDFPIVNGFSIDLHVKKLRERGWALSSRGTGATCPSCKSPKKKDEPEMTTNVVSVNTGKPAAPAPQAVSKPSQEQRLKIRGALDSNFDDAIGAYLGGYSDQKIAEHLNIPRIWVESIREAAYGPIRVSPEVLEIRGEMSKLRNEFEDFRQRMEALVARVGRLGEPNGGT